MSRWIVRMAVERSAWVMAFTALITLIIGAQMVQIQIDTDPENMLAADQSDRVFHNLVEERFSLHDVIVVGQINESETGVYNPRSLAALHELSRKIMEIDGVLGGDLMSLPASDNITQGGQGELIFEWMMKTSPETQEESNQIRLAAERLPMLKNTLVSGDGKAAAVYVPIEDKTIAYAVADKIRAIVATLDTEDAFHVTGLPVAEVTFGHDMFLQMGISAPLAGAMIFILMWLFFRSARLVVAPMIVAIVTVVITMGLFIGLGFTVHIMSSMIPIFLMPIAVVDSVHIMSEFADAYREERDSKAVIAEVVGHLFRPMLFTSLTSAVGFASLVLTPIPPVRVFGAFVALGIMLAFFVTVLFIPAYVVRMNPKSLAVLAQRSKVMEAAESGGLLASVVRQFGSFGFRHGSLVLAVAAGLVAVSVVGLTKIQINDNPVRWFKSDHEIRVADDVLNRHFAGTYDAFLVLERTDGSAPKLFLDQARELLDQATEAGIEGAGIRTVIEGDPTTSGYYGAIVVACDDLLYETEASDITSVEALMGLAELAEGQARYFQDPEALHTVDALQQALAASGYVGKSNALPDIVKVLNRELHAGAAEDYEIPQSRPAVAQLLLQFQSSHRPQDLWHFVTPDYRSTAIWIQLTSGDNQDMNKVIVALDEYLDANPLPAGVTARWAGKSFINVVWQGAMVRGMLMSLLGAFAIVFVMMSLLFRSLIYGLLAMIPLSVTILLIYGLIGWVGKDYDMPIAVLSSLTLGLSVDFAIHFLERFRSLVASTGSKAEAIRRIVEEPARAITRNAIVIAIGFTPLFLAPLMPYVTVGAFMASVMAISGVATLLLLPGAISVLGNRLNFSGVGRQKGGT